MFKKVMKPSGQTLLGIKITTNRHFENPGSSTPFFGANASDLDSTYLRSLVKFMPETQTFETLWIISLFPG